MSKDSPGRPGSRAVPGHMTTNAAPQGTTADTAPGRATQTDDAQNHDAQHRDAQKRAAAEAAVALVQDGTVVGLGTGSTAAFAIEALARRVSDGLRILGVPTSARSATQAREAGIPLTSLADHRRLASPSTAQMKLLRDRWI